MQPAKAGNARRMPSQALRTSLQRLGGFLVAVAAFLLCWIQLARRQVGFHAFSDILPILHTDGVGVCGDIPVVRVIHQQSQ